MIKRLVFTLFLFVFISSLKAENIEPEVYVIDYALTTGIKYKQPTEVAEEFPNTVRRIYLWTKIKAKNPPTYIYHVWYYKDEEVARIRLYIKYPIFRTWSFKTIPPQWTGKWKVVVEDIHGIPVLEKEFFVYKK